MAAHHKNVSVVVSVSCAEVGSALERGFPIVEIGDVSVVFSEADGSDAVDTAQLLAKSFAQVALWLQLKLDEKTAMRSRCTGVLFDTAEDGTQFIDHDGDPCPVHDR